MGQGRGGRPGQAHRAPPRGARGRRAARPRGRPAREPARRQGRREHRRDAAGRVQGAGRGGPPAGEGADAHRHQGHRRDDQRRPWPARADHRRPADRQDVDLHRHDHQQQGLGPDLHLRRDRPADVDGRRRGAAARRRRGARQHDHRRGARRRGGADQVPRSLRRLRHGRALPLQRQARARDLRRPHEARVRVPADGPAAAPPAGARGLPGRRVLPPLTAARALGEAERRPGRRLAHGPAGHRDAGRRRVGLHPDERHLDHRRPDLPRGGPVPLRCAAGDQRGHLGVTRGRLGSDQADEAGCREAPHRAVPVPRAGGVRAVRLRAGRRHPGHPVPRRAAGRVTQPERAQPVGHPGPGGRDLLGHRRLPGPDQGRARERVPRDAAQPAARRPRGADGEDRRRRLGRRRGVRAGRRDRRGDRRLRPRLRRGGQPARGGRVRPGPLRGEP